jgi:hypothetical protein
MNTNPAGYLPSYPLKQSNKTSSEKKILNKYSSVPLSKENIAAHNNTFHQAHKNQDTMMKNSYARDPDQLSGITSRESDSSGSEVSNLTSSTKESSISIAGGRGLVGPDGKGAINKKATCRELLNLLKLSETALKQFLPTLNDGIWVQINPDATQDTSESLWTPNTLACSGWEKMSANQFKDYMATMKKNPSDTLKIKMGLAGSEYFGTFISDIKLGTFPTPHMDRGTGRESIFRKIAFKSFHQYKRSGVTSAQYLNKDSRSVHSYGKGNSRENLEKSQTSDMVLKDVIMTNMINAYKTKFETPSLLDLNPIQVSLKEKLQDLNNALNSVQNNFYPSGMSILVAYKFEESTKTITPVIKLIDPDNCMFIDDSNKDDVNEKNFLNVLQQYNSGNVQSSSVSHVISMAKKIHENNELDQEVNLQNPYLDTVRGAIHSLIIGLNKEIM